MEATIFTGWIYDHLGPHAEQVKVAHPLMLRAIAAAKKKNDRIDAGKIHDALRRIHLRIPRGEPRSVFRGDYHLAAGLSNGRILQVKFGHRYKRGFEGLEAFRLHAAVGLIDRNWFSATNFLNCSCLMPLAGTLRITIFGRSGVMLAQSFREVVSA
jgi:hypothetical protein